MFTTKSRATNAGVPFSFTSPRLVGAVLAALAGAQVAGAGWTVHYLHPSGAEYQAHHSQLLDTHGGQHVGGVASPDFSSGRAGLWNGTAGSWVDLTPAGATGADALGVYNGQQVGLVHEGGGWYASLWSGTAESVVNLAPAGAIYSGALSIHGGQQGGYVQYSNEQPRNAGIWHGTAESFVNLHPASLPTASSGVQRVRDGFQVGWVFDAGIERASLWNGTAESYVDLHPPAAGIFSQLLDVQGGQQVGLIFDLFFNVRAGLWNGTAESFVDITPPGAFGAAATGIDGGFQVGWASFDGGLEAGIWTGGSAESWVSLHQFLDDAWGDSTATSIWRDNDTLYVSGQGYNALAGRYEALLWTYTIPAPGTGALFALGLSAIVRRRRSA